MVKTKALISFAATAKLICVFVFAYTKSQFSHNEAHINPSFIVKENLNYSCNSLVVDLRQKLTVRNINEISVSIQSSELSLF